MIIYKYKCKLLKFVAEYTNIHVRMYRFLSELSFDDFYSRELKIFGQVDKVIRFFDSQSGRNLEPV